jgi:hypothetical protein
MVLNLSKANGPLAVTLLQEHEACLALHFEQVLPGETQSLRTTSQSVPNFFT